MTSHVYYDTTIVNDKEFPIPASINDIRGETIIFHPESWEMSVVRFDINTSLIPATTIPMEPGAILGVGSPSLLTFTMVLGGVPIVKPVDNDSLGNLFGIQKLIDEMNLAVAGIYGALGAPIPTTPPVFYYDTNKRRIQMYFEDLWANDTIEFYCNTTCRQYLFGLPATFIGFQQPDGKDFRLSFQGNAKNADRLIVGAREGYPVITNGIPDPMFFTEQEADVISSWNTTRSIKLTSATLPIVAENEQSNFRASQQGGFSDKSSQVISDFLLSNNDNPITDRISLEYLPTAEYRMISLGGKEGIKRVQISAFFTDLSGVEKPVLLPPNGIFSVKLMFRRRTKEIHTGRLPNTEYE
jgi:hypothetical protein